jgi:biotin carboxylase
MAATRPRLSGMADIRAFFRTNETPIHFVSPTAFNLLGLDRWVRNFFYVNYYDSFQGHHPRVFVPRERPPREFQSIEEICNYLLGHKEVVDFLDSKGRGGKATFVMFDEETERCAAEAGLEIIHPPAALRGRLDSKIVTTQIGNDADVPSVPNVLGRATDYGGLRELADGAGLGDDLVVQTPYGDSGRTTFFVKSRDDWDRYQDDLATQELKVMRRIRPFEVCVEAVITRHGTLVGPYVASLVGYPELTPYKGGWCGNDIYPGLLGEENRIRASAMTQRLGERLAKEGYRGFFEVDYLVDADSGEIYLGELNPRVSGLSPITHVTLGAYSDVPLFLFHLLEYLDVDYEIDVDEINKRWGRMAAEDVWSQLIVKETVDQVEQLTATPQTGIWQLGHEKLTRLRPANDWHALLSEDEAFYLRVASPGEYRYKGADLGVLVTRGRMQTDDFQLTDRCRAWLKALRAEFAGVPAPPAESYDAPMAFKSY